MSGIELTLSAIILVAIGIAAGYSWGFYDGGNRK